jgi:hypothetical protein
MAKFYRSKHSLKEYSCEEYSNLGDESQARKYGKKDLPLSEYPFDFIVRDELKEHEHGFNIRVLYFDGTAPHLKSGMSTSDILWNIITLYHHECFDEIEDIRKSLIESPNLLAGYTNTVIAFVTNEMAAFCNAHKVRNPGKLNEMMPLPIYEFPVWFNNLEDLLSDLTWSKKERKILITEVLPKMINTFEVYADIIKTVDFSLADSSEVEKMIDEVIVKFPDKVAAYKSGKIGLINMLFGEVMKMSGGKIDKNEARSLLEKKLSS